MSADTVEETSDAFLENLGTIEVIVLRCKDAPQPPVNVPTPRASTVEDSIRISREDTSKPTSRPASKRQSTHCTRVERKEPSVKAKAPSKEPSTKEKVPSKVPSKVESKAAPKPPTAKTESEIGGFFGLFDGASDDPSIQPKPYWSDWNKRPVNNGPHPSRRDLMYIAPEDPLPSVPKAVARSKHLEHQVKTGKGAQYLHLCARPEYLDSMQKPYAVFTFKYRSKRVIEKKFKITIKEEGEHLKAKLADMSKDELAEELYRLRVSLPPLPRLTELTKIDGQQGKQQQQEDLYPRQGPHHRKAYLPQGRISPARSNLKGSSSYTRQHLGNVRRQDTHKADIEGTLKGRLEGSDCSRHVLGCHSSS